MYYMYMNKIWSTNVQKVGVWQCLPLWLHWCVQFFYRLLDSGFEKFSSDPHFYLPCQTLYLPWFILSILNWKGTWFPFSLLIWSVTCRGFTRHRYWLKESFHVYIYLSWVLELWFGCMCSKSLGGPNSQQGWASFSGIKMAERNTPQFESRGR